MKTIISLTTVLLLSLSSGDIQKKLVNNRSLIMAAQHTTESPDIQVVKITLLAREEKMPPIGELAHPNRDIGFASVFIRLTNLKESDSKITIQNIKIVNVNNGTSQNFSFSPKKIVLHPLENSEQVFHLKNKTGYSGKEPVKAIVIYEIGNLVSQIDSDLTEVDRL
ncbi:hypothetical protein [Calothrix sp. PCC 7507]|uniref:hypothetical protein n=1 Tax=Calothrix sp. PCC 7507 TaxID=99598 RepID=UPI00029EFF52|nr:hypothetical protein [Calothrix sp. PCC 7507]AFY31974.1 hypothetical protein Cal7507_1510 [Calothrix sp. PCC 7507]